VKKRGAQPKGVRNTATQTTSYDGAQGRVEGDGTRKPRYAPSSERKPKEAPKKNRQRMQKKDKLKALTLHLHLLLEAELLASRHLAQKRVLHPCVVRL
jgi:hypothetical protein